MVQQKQDDDKKIDNILEELNKVLDEMTSTTETKRDIEEVKEKNEGLFNVSKKIDVELNTNLRKQTDKFIEVKQDISDKDLQKQLDTPQQLPKLNSLDKEEIIKIKTALLYPDMINNVKDKFIENLNSTLNKVSKKPIKILLSLCKNYTSLEKDILLQFSQLLEEIKRNNIEALFLIVKETSSLEEDFIKKLCSYLLVAKVVSYKDLDLKSTYLDISIDLLLITR
ncbi:MAG: hypothetical protein ACK4WJ_03505 [Endomicrobiia bacterium]